MALLREEELQAYKPKSFGRGFTKATERTRTNKTDKLQSKFEHEDKLASLKQYRRKNGLCFKCGGKWGANHTCLDQIPLHVLEELWEALELAQSDETEEVQSEIANGNEAVMTVQAQESKQGTRRQTLKLLAQIGKQQVLILVDSGSIGTFISDHLVTTMKLPVQPCAPANFKAADGGTAAVH